MAKAGILVSGRGIFVHDNIIIRKLPGNALCLTSDPNNEHLSAAKKTAIVKISKPHSFGCVVTQAAKGLLGERLAIEVVEYRDDRESVGTVPISDPHPFVKRTRFAPESEVRMYWPLAQGSAVTVKHPAILEFVARVA